MLNSETCNTCTNSNSQAKGTNSNTPVGITYVISGMDCAEEVTILKREVGPLVEGEENLVFDVLNARMTILNVRIDESRVIQAVNRTGMKATRINSHETSTDLVDINRRKTVIMTSISGILLAAAFLSPNWILDDSLAAILYTIAIITGGWFIFPKAIYSLKRLRPDMNLLMTTAVIGAVYIGEWLEAALVTFLFSLSLALESWSVSRARKAISALMAISPDTARIKQEDGTEHEMLAKDVPVGSKMIVLGGDRISLDATVLQGHSLVNQAPITGESLPVEKSHGDTVYAGTINGDGTLEVITTTRSTDTTLANIIRLVSDAQNKRAPSEQWVEKFARIYTPIIMVLALATFVLPVLLGFSWEVWFYRALILLVIACPCALVISTPVSIVASLAAAAQAGVLVKGGRYLEIPGQLKAIAMDKTGTITEGKPTVVQVISLSNHSEEEVLECAAALEAHSTHPIAKAVLTYAEQKYIKFSIAENIKTIPGKGIVGIVKGQKYWLGSPRHLQEQNLDTAQEAKTAIDELEKKGGTIIAIGNNQHVCGLLAVSDTIRPNAFNCIQQLKKLGIQHIVMLTGDNEITAKSIATQVGINEFKSELLPEDKVAAITQLVDTYGHVGMIGDGVNDAPAMGRASIGIAMGAIGSDAAIESSDIALMSDDLSRLPWIIKHSRNTLNIIKQNIWLALITKGVFLILGIIGAASLWVAIAADMGTTFVVIANSLRLLQMTKHGQIT